MRSALRSRLMVTAMEATTLHRILLALLHCLLFESVCVCVMFSVGFQLSDN